MTYILIYFSDSLDEDPKAELAYSSSKVLVLLHFTSDEQDDKFLLNKHKIYKLYCKSMRCLSPNTVKPALRGHLWDKEKVSS